MSNPRAYYNEIDPYAAQWLRNLISAGHIAPGDVDTRSIEDVTAGDLVGFTQCHFFAGIGGWSAALRLAGWPDDRAVWTGSCPCQPFSQAGKGAGTADERHLWPAWFHLINECRPAVVFGEQVEAAIAHGWLDLVQDDLEGISYAFAPVGVPAAGVGAPHIRHRLWWVADAMQPGRAERGTSAGVGSVAGSGVLGSLANNNNNRRNSETTSGFHNEKYHTEPRGDVGDANAQRLPLRQSPEIQRARGGMKGEQLNNQAVHLLPASGQTPTGSPAVTAKRDQLNPALSRWLQGYPTTWDDCAPMAMPSSRRLVLK